MRLVPGSFVPQSSTRKPTAQRCARRGVDVQRLATVIAVVGLLVSAAPGAAQVETLDEWVIGVGGFGAYRGGMDGSSWEPLEGGFGGEAGIRMVSQGLHSVGLSVIVTAHEFQFDDRDGTILEAVGEYRLYALTGGSSPEPLRPYVGLRAGYLRESLDPIAGEEGVEGDAGDSGFMGGLEAGLSYRLSPAVDLELQGSFEYADLNDGRTARSYVLRAGFTFFPEGRPGPRR